jgi:hypothetical protein
VEDSGVGRLIDSQVVLWGIRVEVSSHSGGPPTLRVGACLGSATSGEDFREPRSVDAPLETTLSLGACAEREDRRAARPLRRADRPRADLPT